MPHCLIIGGGPVGALTALSLHKRGWDVELWDARPDPRGNTLPTNLRSINLAISSRGIEAIRSVDPALAEQFLAMSIPMKGRMIHTASGTESQLYDPIGGQSIRSCSRPLMNQRLVEALPDAIVTRFNTKLTRIDFEAKIAYAESVSSPFDLVIGCDGAWSKVRSEMMRSQRINFSQSFISHAYLELHMPSKNGYAMDPNHLHIWPRHSFMLIALPNKDGSFTLTLFVPYSTLDTINSRAAAERFFKENFQSALEIVGDTLIDDFMTNPRSSLVTINVSPAHAPHALLLGDASHCMVPFYGQGLNCGLEDVRVFNSILEHHDIDAALEAYSETRKADLEAICKLALDNYTEMRSHVLSPLHRVRRVIDSALSTLMPSHAAPALSLTEPFPTKRVRGWTSLYEMVTFRPDIGYSEALRRELWQRQVVAWAGWTGVGLALGVVGFRVFRR